MPAKRHEFNLRFSNIDRIGDQVRIAIAEDLQFTIGNLSDRFGNKKDIGYANRRIAQLMKQAVLAEYDANVAARKKNNYALRGRKDRYTGQLRSALAKHVVSGAGQQIRFVNITKLDQEARHWKRLNFGVFGTEIKPPDSPSFPVRFQFGAASGSTTIGFNQGGRAPFALPFGVFRDGKTVMGKDASRRGMDWFMPVSKFANNRNGLRKAAAANAGTPTRGVEPRRFLEAGLQAYAENAPAIYRELVDKWLRPDGGKPVIRRL